MEELYPWDLICENCGKRVRIWAKCYKTAKEQAEEQHKCIRDRHASVTPFTWAFPVEESIPLR